MDIDNLVKLVLMKQSEEPTTKPTKRSHWVGLGIGFGSLIVISFVLAYLFGKVATRFDITQYDFAWLGYLIVFGVALVSNLTIIAPVPFAIAIMVTASTKWNPAIIALAGTVGGSIGELSGYLAGYLGAKIAIPDHIPGHNRIEHWIQKYGVWAFFLLALQPIIPFDIGGLIAGATRIPLHKFLPALFLGRLIKYMVIAYAGAGVIQNLPFLTQE